MVVYFSSLTVPGDAFTYLAAGERLNAGHQLYALGPGDRPVELHPPYWTVPLVSTPPLAGLGAHIEYLSLLGRGAFSASPLSLGGLAHSAGLPDEITRLLPMVAALAGALAVFLLRRRTASRSRLPW